MTASAFAGRLVRAALRPVVLEDVPPGWDRQAFDPGLDDDALAWLGFEPGQPDEPLLPWPRPAIRPAVGRRITGRHGARARARTA